MEIYYWSGDEWVQLPIRETLVVDLQKRALALSFQHPVKFVDRGELLAFFFRGETYDKREIVRALPPDSIETILAKFLKDIPMDVILKIVNQGESLQGILAEHVENLAAESNYVIYANDFFSGDFIDLAGGQGNFYPSVLNAPDLEFEEEEFLTDYEDYDGND